mmetsp:Transcript_4430/g.12400  ORF Transcript_4430/g.12400 Transcript_4430/m.12400 type:complete len:236 (+) Transcript_4430:1577-2284(+)
MWQGPAGSTASSATSGASLPRSRRQPVRSWRISTPSRPSGQRRMDRSHRPWRATQPWRTGRQCTLRRPHRRPCPRPRLSSTQQPRQTPHRCNTITAPRQPLRSRPLLPFPTSLSSRHPYRAPSGPHTPRGNRGGSPAKTARPPCPPPPGGPRQRPHAPARQTRTSPRRATTLPCRCGAMPLASPTSRTTTGSRQADPLAKEPLWWLPTGPRLHGTTLQVQPDQPQGLPRMRSSAY